MNERTRRTILGGVIPVAVAALGFGPIWPMAPSCRTG